MTPALVTLLALIAAPGSWTVTNQTPPTICQELSSTCLIRTRDEVLVAFEGSELVAITPFRGIEATLAWNQVLLRSTETRP